jgi:glutamyl-tRNA synthetase
VITRLAPTPSGFLHRGNAVNFLLIAWLAERHGGETVLRIDDMDAVRHRPAFVADIFEVLDWLGIAWQRGPGTAAEFEAHYSLRSRTPYYREQLDLLRASGIETYACRCSRRELQAAGTLACAGHCRDEGLRLETGETALRVRVPEGTCVEVSDQSVPLAAAVGDFVVWRRDGLPAYHLASVVEDRDAGITHIVRGSDLLTATAAQLYLAAGLGAASVLHATYLHHPLVTGPDGAKLSKSHLRAGPLERSAALRDDVRRMAERIGEPFGIGPGI